MALSTEEKATNKARFKARDAAFAARRQAYRSARDRALATFESSPVQQEAKLASSALNAAMQDVRAAERRIDEQIAELQEQRKALREIHRIDELNDFRIKTMNAAIKARDAVEDELAAQFSDVANVQSAVTWAQGGHWKPEDRS
jgi:hypothetical protein